MRSLFSNNKKGQSLIEIMIAISLFAILMPALITGLTTSRQGKAQQKQRLIAITLMKELKEATLSIREKGWSYITTPGTYHPVIDTTNNSWKLDPNVEVTANGFTRSIVISDVLRLNGAIVLSGGSVDPSTKRVVSTVSWSVPLLSSVSSTSYITRHTNISELQTTQAVFDQGVLVDTYTTSTEGGPNSGEVILGAGGQGLWCDPNLSITSLDLPKNGEANALYAIEGHAFAGTGENASGVSFAKINITNEDPPVPSLGDTFDGYKTNDVFGETNYAYLATDTNAKEIVIIDLNQVVGGKYVEVGYFDATGSNDAKSVFVVGDRGYMTQGGTFRIFDLASKSGSRNQLGSVSLGETGNSIHVVGDYAFIARDDDSNDQLQIIDVSNPSSPTKVGQADVAGLSGKDVFVNDTGTRAYLITHQDAIKKEFFIIDVSTKTGDRPTLGTYEVNGMEPKGVTVVTGNKAIIVGIGAEEYQVVDITTESTPTRCGGLNIDAGVNSVSSVLEADGDAFSYIVTKEANAEFKIIAGGAGGQYESTGTFESLIFDNNTSTAFNTFSAHVAKPNATNLQIQVAVANKINGSCNGVTYTYLGPNGSSSQYFTTGSDPDFIRGQIPFTTSETYINPGSCFRYKVWFSTTDSTATPILYDFTVNYSP